jgi:hypothetical protein
MVELNTTFSPPLLFLNHKILDIVKFLSICLLSWDTGFYTFGNYFLVIQEVTLVVKTSWNGATNV